MGSKVPLLVLFLLSLGIGSAAKNPSAVMLENQNFKIVIEPKNGAISSFLVKKNNCDLVGEKRLVRDAIDSGKPVLGICLGAQLIASALAAGASVAVAAVDAAGPPRKTEFVSPAAMRATTRIPPAPIAAVVR